MHKFLIVFFLSVINLFGQEKSLSSYFKAEQFFFQKSYTKALKISNAISEQDPYYINALVLSGHIYLHLDLPDSAEIKFFSILKTDHQNSLAYNGLGLVYYNKITPSKRVIQRLKNFFIETNEEKAEKMFLRALKYNENYPDARYNIARLYLKSVDKTKKIMSENILSGLIKSFPENSLYVFAIGEAKFLLEKYDEAKTYFLHLISDNPNDTKSRLQLSFCYLRLEEFKDFSKNFSEAIQYLTDQDAQSQLVRDSWDILTKTEKKSIQTFNIRPNFFYELWIKKDPNPISEINERLVIHYKRLSLARELYRADTFTGYDDRGAIYVRYGKPDQRYQDPMPGPNTKGNISWAYNISGEVLTFDFVESGAEYNLVDDLSEALTSGTSGTTTLKSLIGLYEKRTHLSQSYARVLSDLNSVSTDDPNAMRDNSRYSYIISRHRMNKIKEREQTPLSTYPFKLAGSDFLFDFNYSYFLENQDQIRLEFYFSFDYENLRIGGDGINYRDINQEIIIQTSNREPLLHSKNQLKIKNINSSSGKYITQTNAFVNQSSLFCSIQMEDEDNNQRRLLTFPIAIHPIKKDILNVSSIELAGSIKPFQKQDAPVFKKNGLTVIPHVSSSLSASDPIFMYFEIYELRLNSLNEASYTVETKITDVQSYKNLSDLIKKISPFGDKTSAITTSIERNAYEKNTYEYVGLDISALKKGQYKLQVTVSDLTSGHIVNRNVKFNVVN